MSTRGRYILFFLGAAGLAAFFAIAFFHLPGDLSVRNRYAGAINSRSVTKRNTTDAVTAVNFDFRGFDTLGEEFILFAAVIGSLVLLREAEDKRTRVLRDAITPGRDVDLSDSGRLWTLGMVAPKLLFGVYIVTHGQLSPGGGFQGGVILATVALIIYLGEDFTVFRNIMNHTLVEIVEAAGAALFAITGLVALCFGSEFLTNYLPLGKPNQLTSAGTIPIISFVTGMEVTGGFVLLLHAFLQANLTREEKEEAEA